MDLWVELEGGSGFVRQVGGVVLAEKGWGRWSEGGSGVGQVV